MFFFFERFHPKDYALFTSMMNKLRSVMRNMEKRILFVANVAKDHIIKFHIPAIKYLKDHGWTVDAACSGNELIPFCDHQYSMCWQRSPYTMKTFKGIRDLKQIIEGNHYNVVYCHTPVGGLAARIAAKKARKQGTKVIYMAHGFHFYKGAPLKNWLFYFPVERICAHWTDSLITINHEDYEFAKRKLKAKQVVYVSGVGFDSKKFINTYINKEEKRKELGIPSDCKLIVSVGELNKNKNHKVVIEAMAEFESVHYAIAGEGPERENLLALAKQLKISDRVHLLGYRSDIAEIYKCADICCLPSFREGLNVSGLEGMACGLPLIASNIRGVQDYAVDQINGYLCNPKEPEPFAKAIETLISNEHIRSIMGKRNISAAEKFDQKNVLSQMLELYKDYLSEDYESDDQRPTVGVNHYTHI